MKILIVDSYNMIHRARYGFRFSEHNVIFGFFRCLKSEIDRHDPDLVYLVSEGKPQHRYDISPEYKANRKKEKDTAFLDQVSEIFSICKNFPVSLIKHPNYECDDVVGMLCDVYPNAEITICSSDSDFIQLLEMENVSLWNPVKKAFVEKWPVDYCTWKALKGDPTDNISGVKGVGEKTAYKLASDPNALSDFLSRKKEAEKAFKDSYELIKFAKIDPNDPMIKNLRFSFDEKNLFETFSNLSFKSIVGKSWPKWKERMEKLCKNDEAKRNII